MLSRCRAEFWVGLNKMNIFRTIGNDATSLIWIATISLLGLSFGCARVDSAPVGQSPVAVGTPIVKQAPEKKATIESRPSIVSRTDWKAQKPVGEGKPHSIRFITIHHTAELQKPGRAIEAKMQSLQNFSQSVSKLASGKTKPAWFDVPYHFYIAVDGKIAEGRELAFAGDTNTDYDPTGHALVVLEGNFETEQPTAEQLVSLDKMTLWLAEKFKVSAVDVKAHNDYAQTACPGVNLKKLMSDLRAKVGKDK